MSRNFRRSQSRSQIISHTTAVVVEAIPSSLHMHHHAISITRILEYHTQESSPAGSTGIIHTSQPSILPSPNHSTRRHLLVVPVQDPDAGTPVQELPPVEEPTEVSLGDSPRNNPKASWPHPEPGPDQYRGAARRTGMQLGGTYVSCHYRRRTDVRPTGGRRG